MAAMQEEDLMMKITASCLVQGDVVLECIHIGDNLEHEETMFHVMFNTAFIRSNILFLKRDDIDISWNANDQFPRDFRAEVINSFVTMCFTFFSYVCYVERQS